VAQFGKLLRWLFGINAILFCAVSVRYIWAFPALVTHDWSGAGASAERLVDYAVLAGVFATAFFALGAQRLAGGR